MKIASRSASVDRLTVKFIPEEITAILLAGGQGSRMGYRDKAWVNYQGRPLVSHVIEAISPQVGEVIVSQNANHPGWLASGLTTVPDTTSLGPLSGILSCSKLISAPLTLIVPCDIPNLPNNLARSLAASINGSELAVASDNVRQQNLVLLAQTQCLASIETFLAENRRSVFDWINTRSSVSVHFEQSFRNINDSNQLSIDNPQ